MYRVLILALPFLFAGCDDPPSEQVANYASAKAITAEQLIEIANNYKEELPRQIASNLTVVNLEIRPGPTLTYFLVWKDGPDADYYLENWKTLNAAAIAGGCNGPNNPKILLEAGVRVQYIARKPDGTLIYDIEFGLSDCPE